MNDKHKLTREAFKELKKSAEIETDYKLAKVLNMPTATIYRYTNGVNSITLEKLGEIANKLNKEVIIKFTNKKK